MSNHPKKNQKSATLSSNFNTFKYSTQQNQNNPSSTMNNYMTKPPTLNNNIQLDNSFDRDSSCDKKSVSVKKKKKQSSLLGLKNNDKQSKLNLKKQEFSDLYEPSQREKQQSVKSKRSQKKPKQNNLAAMLKQPNLKNMNSNAVTNKPSLLEDFTSEKYTQTSKNKSQKKKVKENSLKQLVKDNKVNTLSNNEKKYNLNEEKKYYKKQEIIQKEQKYNINKYQYAEQSAVVNVKVQQSSKFLKSNDRKNIFKQSPLNQFQINKIHKQDNQNFDNSKEARKRKKQNTISYLIEESRQVNLKNQSNNNDFKNQQSVSSISQIQPKNRQRKKLGNLLKESRQKNQYQNSNFYFKNQDDNIQKIQLSKIQSSRLGGSKTNIKFIGIQKKPIIKDDTQFQSQLEQSKASRQAYQKKQQFKIDQKKQQFKVHHKSDQIQNQLKNSFLKYSKSPPRSIDSEEQKKSGLKQQSLFFAFQKIEEKKQQKKRKGLNVTSKENSLSKIKNSPISQSEMKIQDVSQVHSQSSNKSKKKKVKQSTLQFLRKKQNEKYYDFKVQNSPNKINDSFYQDQIKIKQQTKISEIPKVIMFDQQPILTKPNNKLQNQINYRQKQISKTSDNFYQKQISQYQPSIASSKPPLSKKPPTNKSKKSIDSKKSMKSSKQSSLSDYVSLTKQNKIQNKKYQKQKIQIKDQQPSLTLDDIVRLKKQTSKKYTTKQSIIDETKSRKSHSKKKQSNLKDYMLKSNSSDGEYSDRSDSKSRKSIKNVKQNTLSHLRNQAVKKQKSPERVVKGNYYYINKNGSLVKQDVFIKSDKSKTQIQQPKYLQTQYSNQYSYKFGQTNFSVRSRSKKSKKSNRKKSVKKSIQNQNYIQNKSIQKKKSFKLIQGKKQMNQMEYVDNRISTLQQFIKPIQYKNNKKQTLQNYYYENNYNEYNKNYDNGTYYGQQQPPSKVLTYNELFEKKKLPVDKKKMKRTQR